MPLRVKVDEDLSEEVAAVFAAAGYVSDTLRTQGWGGLLAVPLQAEGSMRRGVWGCYLKCGLWDDDREPYGREGGLPEG